MVGVARLLAPGCCSRSASQVDVGGDDLCRRKRYTQIGMWAFTFLRTPLAACALAEAELRNTPPRLAQWRRAFMLDCES